MTIILDNCPPSTLQGVGLGGRKNPRIIVGESYCHFGASYVKARLETTGFSVHSLQIRLTFLDIGLLGFLKSEVSKRGWREGVGDKQTPKKSPKSSPEMCPHSPKGA